MTTPPQEAQLCDGKLWKTLWWFMKGWLGFHGIKDGSTCWFSAHFFEVHDYHEKKGGDGYPMHFYNYTCSRCGKEFFI